LKILALRRWTNLTLLGLLLTQSASRAAAPSDPIRLNSLGFLPAQSKQASIAALATNFSLIRSADGVTVFTGFIGAARLNLDTGESLFTADFSAFTNSGIFQLDVPGVGRSIAFRVGSDVYREAFTTVTRAMYLWRCGTAVSGVHHGDTFSHAACHPDDAWLDFVGGGSVRRNSPGGWHDAGDYNKYVVNAGVTVGCLFRAWEDFKPALKNYPLHLPESGGGLPDFLAELKWELDWLLTMQAQDGSVYHKLSTRDFGGMILPEHESAKRYFTPWSSAATADFVAMLAQGARNFREYDPAYAARCLAAAQASYRFLLAHPENHRADLTGFTTGGYPTRDDDDRLWAAAELWATTGETNYLHDFETRAKQAREKIDSSWDWSNVGNLGMLTYLFSERPGRDEQLVATLRNAVIGTADEIVKKRNAHGYARPLGSYYHWGGNGTVARQTVVLQAAHRLAAKPEYRLAALDALGYLFGRNPFGRSFVTGLGHQPPLHPHDRRSHPDSIVEPWPGYLVGGPNPKAADWQDVEEDYRTNEIAINWNGALIYALAMFLENVE